MMGAPPSGESFAFPSHEGLVYHAGPEDVCMKILAAVLAFLLGAVVRDPGTLTPTAAGGAINKYLQGMSVAFSVELGRVGTGCADTGAGVINIDPTQEIEFIAAQKAGAVTVTPDGPHYWRVDLKETSAAAAEALKKIPHKVANGCDYQHFGLGVARKALVEVVNIRQLGETTAEVEFTWKWTHSSFFAKLPEQLSPAQQKELEAYFPTRVPPQNNAHFSFADISDNSQPHPGKRTLKKTDDGWRPAFDREIASQVIAAKLNGETKDIAVAIGRVGSHCASVTQVEARTNPETDIFDIVAKNAGYVSVIPDGAGCWRVSLTDRGQSARIPPPRHGVAGEGDFQLVAFTVAKPSLVQITGITGDESSPEVEYLWKWVATDLGGALRVNGHVYSSLTMAQRATLRKLLAMTDLSPALPLPVPSEERGSPATRAKVRLRESKGMWFW
jgi:hypothetical protein